MIQNQSPSLVRLRNPIKQYEWGRANSSCCVAQLSGKTNCKKYAELWMGVHTHGESEVCIDKNGQQSQHIKLSQYMQKNNCKPLQFMYKVLSIQKCLSIQVHPNKQLAVQLRKSKPGIYADDNDKPEMFYTLTQFECFIGYINSHQFERICKLKVFQQYIKQKFPQTPKQMILQLLNLQQQQNNKLVNECINLLKQIHPQRYDEQKSKGRKIRNMITDFPNDIGIVVSFFIEYKIIPAGTCYYIQSGTPHAYVFGECLEIMKNSDNVCRLGLTPKHKDLESAARVLNDQSIQRFPIQPILNQYSKLTSEFYSEKGLNFQILKASSHSNQSSKIYRSSCKWPRICLILEGQFIIQQKNHKHHQNQSLFKKGDCLLLNSQIDFQIIPKRGSLGTACVGWSQF